MSAPSSHLKVFATSVLVVALVALVATVVAIRDRGVFDAQCELMSIAQEDAARRIRTLKRNQRIVREHSEKTAISAARSLARLVENDESLERHPERLKDVASDLNVDEVCLIGSNGFVTASWPARYIGYDMRSAEQSAMFLPALTNRAFELVQEPCARGFSTTNGADGGFAQYVGVARRDRPGLVQVCYSLDRLDELNRLGDVRTIAALTRIGRGGFVEVESAHGRTQSGEFVVMRDKRPMLAVESTCEDWRIRVLVPVTWTFLANDTVFQLLIIFDLLLVILMIVACTPHVMLAGLAAVRSVVALVMGLDVHIVGGARSRNISGAIIFLSTLVFGIAVMVSWTFQSRSADNMVSERLHAIIDEVHNTVEDSVGDMLSFAGNAICHRYQTPEAITPQILHDVMDRYDIDEMNVVNSDGIVRAGALANVGYDMASNPLSGEFNCLLRGRRVFMQNFRGAVEDPSIRCKYVGVAFPGKANGYIQMGFSEKRLKDVHDYWFDNIADGWHMPFGGFGICASLSTGEIVSCGRPEYRRGVDTLASIGLDMARVPQQPDEIFRATLYGIPCFCVQRADFYHRFVIAIPVDEIARLRNTSVMTFAAILFLILAFCAFFLSRLVALVTSLRHYIATDGERRRKDLALARTIQLSSLPVQPSEVPDYGVYATMRPARDVGGDFYDYFPMPNGREMVLIADVSGKGVPAAMFMMRAKATIRSAVGETDDLAEAVTRINAALAENNDGEMFVTAWFGSYDRTTGEIEYVNAGHNQPLVRRRDGSVSYLSSRPGLVLAAMEGVRYRTGNLRLEPGESLLLYTDGVTEAMSQTEELYGEARLKSRFERSGRHFVTEILEDLASFTRGAEQSDDITMLALDRRILPDLKDKTTTD